MTTMMIILIRWMMMIKAVGLRGPLPRDEVHLRGNGDVIGDVIADVVQIRMRMRVTHVRRFHGETRHVKTLILERLMTLRTTTRSGDRIN